MNIITAVACINWKVFIFKSSAIIYKYPDLIFRCYVTPKRENLTEPLVSLRHSSIKSVKNPSLISGYPYIKKKRKYKKRT